MCFPEVQWEALCLCWHMSRLREACAPVDDVNPAGLHFILARSHLSTFTETRKFSRLDRSCKVLHSHNLTNAQLKMSTSFSRFPKLKAGSFQPCTRFLCIKIQLIKCCHVCCVPMVLSTIFSNLNDILYYITLYKSKIIYETLEIGTKPQNPLNQS